MRLRFGDYEFDEERFVLTRSGEPIAIQPKPLELLLQLLQRHPATVTKDELLDALWPDAAVTEASLTRAVRAARRALGERADSEGVIRTVRGRGYAISVPVEVLEDRPRTADRAAMSDAPLERRLAAILSADAVQYRRHIADDEQAAVTALERNRQIIASRVEERGGRVVDVVGDNLMAEFASVVEALRAAIDAQKAMSMDVEETESAAGALRFRIGVHVGDLLVDGQRVFGDGVNIAARLEELAPPGGVCVSDVVVDQVGGKVPIEWRDLGERHLKNVAAPVHVFAVADLGQDLDASPSGSNAPPRRRDFVGREAPLSELEAALSDAEAGRGVIAFLVGEPGIGKTRTAEELATAATARGAEVVWGRCMEGEAAPALWPWAQVLRAAVISRETEALRRQLGSRAPFVAELVSEIRDALPDLPEIEHHDPEERRLRFQDGLARFIHRAAQERPLVLVIEDLHWADSSSLQLLRFLAPELAASRVLLLLTYRDVAAEPGEDLDLALSDLARLPHARPAIPLRGLSVEDVGRLVERATGVKPRAELLESMHARTEGNPFFITELIRLAASGTDLYETGRRAIPSSVKAVVRQRAAALPEPSRALLDAAAVIGREVPIPLLAAVLSRPENDLFDDLDTALDSGLLIEHPKDPEMVWFSHALVQETIYDALARRQRVRLHRAVGEAIEALYSPRVEPFLPALAHHFRQSAFGDQFEKAVDYLERAASQARSQLAFERAAELCGDAIRLLDARGPGDERRRAALLLARGQALIESGRPHDGQALAWRAIDTALDAGAPEIVVDAARGLLGNSYTSAFGDDLVHVLKQALPLLDPADEKRQVIGLCARARAAYFLRPVEELEAQCDEAVARARVLGDLGTLCWALASLSTILLCTDRLDKLERVLAEWLERSRDAHDSLGEYLCRIHRLSLAMDMIDPSEIERNIESCDRMSQALRRRPIVEGPLVDMRATWLLGRGELTEAEELNAKALELNQRADQARAFGAFAIKLALIRLAQGRLSEYLPVLTGNLDALTSWMAPSLEAGMGIIECALGRSEDASLRLRAVAFSDRLGRRDLLNPLTLALACQLADELEDREAAQRLYDVCEPLAGRCAHAYVSAWWGSMDRALGLCAKTLGRFDLAEHHLENALAIDRRLGARLFEAMTLTDWARVRLLRNEGADERLARGQLQDARRIADEILAKGIAERAAAPLG